MKLVKGSDIHPSRHAAILARFVYRLTTENGYPERNPCGATCPAISDAQWIAEHAFWLRKDGQLVLNRRYAEPAFMADLQTASRAGV